MARAANIEYASSSSASGPGDRFPAVSVTGIHMSLREEVEALLPNWESWYPSLFHAAEDLGLIRARVCAPSSLLLTNRHSAVQSDALNAYREKWGGKE